MLGLVVSMVLSQFGKQYFGARYLRSLLGLANLRADQRVALICGRSDPHNEAGRGCDVTDGY